MSDARFGADYRPDIDGLRALAVLLVVFYHLHLGPFRGGYVGVDVFFVISAFLITRLIVREVREEHTFSFGRFYGRRLRRIVPALVVTVALAGVLAFLLLSPDEFADFGGSVVTAALSVSNVFFCLSSGYFDAEARTRPLLHLWSLGVEEQFYAVWPLMLVLLLKWSDRVAIWTIAILGIVSVLLAQWWVTGHSGLSVLAGPSLDGWLQRANDAAFYLTPFRAFELAIGGLMVWGVAVPPRSSILRELLLLAGLALILGAAVAYRDDTTFPGLSALVPSAGAALVIYAGPASKAGWLLRNRIAVGLGLISYSVYLLHWPLIVLLRQYREVDLTRPGKLALLGLVLGGAAVMYRWVEQPCRRPASPGRTVRPVVVLAVVVMMMLGVTGARVWAAGGWAWRIPPSRQGSTPQEWTAKEYAYCGHWDRGLPRDLAPCQNNRSMPRTIIVWGDSHALHLVAGLSEAYPDYNVFVFYRPGCIPASGFVGYEGRLDDRRLEADCIEHNRKTLPFLQRYPPSIVVLSNTKRDTPDDVAAPTAYVVSQLRAAGHTVVLLGDFIAPGRSPVTCRSVPAWLIPDRVLRERCSPDPAQVHREWQYSDALRARLPDIVDVRQVQCPAGDCEFWAADGTPFFRDSNHLTTVGSIHFIRDLRDQLPIRTIRTPVLRASQRESVEPRRP